MATMLLCIFFELHESEKILRPKDNPLNILEKNVNIKRGGNSDFDVRCGMNVTVPRFYVDWASTV